MAAGVVPHSFFREGGIMRGVTEWPGSGNQDSQKTEEGAEEKRDAED